MDYLNPQWWIDYIENSVISKLARDATENGNSQRSGDQKSIGFHLQISVLLGTITGLALAYRQLQLLQPGFGDLIFSQNPRLAIGLNVAILVGILSGLAMATFFIDFL
eukprot:m.190511 g.190511  ORF g.190511 m.190511 type:complete len:108 (+) comp32405_c12_seq1:83-406(+)